MASIEGAPIDWTPDKEKLNPHTLAIITGKANPQLAKVVSARLSEEAADIIEPIVAASRFDDEEVRVSLPDMRNKQVFIIQPTIPPADNILELEFMLDAARGASAHQDITAIIPYFGYGREDKPTEHERHPSAAAVIAENLHRQGAQRFVIIDLHNTATRQTVKEIPWELLHGSSVLIPAVMERGFNTKDFIVVSPDAGGIKRAEAFAERMGGPQVIFCHKRKTSAGNEVVAVARRVSGKSVVVVDDMISKGGTVVTAAEQLKEKGAKEIIVAATHGLFIKNALKRIENAPIDEVLVTDTLAHRPEVLNHKKITVVSVAPLIAEAIKRLKNHQSISELNRMTFSSATNSWSEPIS